METLGNDNGAKTSTCEYYCNICDYKCFKKFNLDRHFTTSKHLEEMKWNKLEEQKEQKEQKEQNTKLFACEKCNKEFKTSSGLWKHKQKCCSIDNDFLDKEPSDKELIMMLIKENSDLKKDNNELKSMIIDACKNMNINNLQNSYNTNSHNKTFNLQFFLNETCKDAMNINDFVESVQLQVADLENVGKVGYIEGISNIIIKNLNALDMEKRPIHCADQKREVLYVKDENIWEKEDEENQRLRKAIRKIAHKNICMLKAFREKYPDCEQYNSKKGNQYDKIVIEAMGGHGDNDYEKNTKIIKKIAKAVGIDKKMG